MDARMDMGLIAGIGLGEAHVIRNAGGRASDDAIRSLVFSHKLLGTEEFFVIHHTDCGLEYVTSDDMGHMLAKVRRACTYHRSPFPRRCASAAA